VTNSDSPYLDWDLFWSSDPIDHNWLYEPVLAYGRGHAIYARKKQGKSLFVLSLAAHLATNDRKVTVIYLDYEMTKEDVYERLEDMGYGPDSDLSRLKYVLLPSLPPLDSKEGGAALMDLVDYEQANHPERHVVVVIDTFGRAVVSPENSADTTRAFYRYTGLELKKRGVTYVRLDHEGKDGAREQRGSSAKGDDVDVVWKVALKSTGDLVLHLDVARMSWVPAEVYLIRRTDPLSFDVKHERIPAIVESIILELDLHDVPSKASVREAQAALKQYGIPATGVNVQAAVRHRKQRRHTLDTPTSTHSDDENG
jgi:KaiC/GvpD/RAD55 family RecA-like ATPase